MEYNKIFAMCIINSRVDVNLINVRHVELECGGISLIYETFSVERENFPFSHASERSIVLDIVGSLLCHSGVFDLYCALQVCRNKKICSA